MKIKAPKLDPSLLVETVGVALVTYGVFLLFPPLAFITLGAFLVWVTERQ